MPQRTTAMVASAVLGLLTFMPLGGAATSISPDTRAVFTSPRPVQLVGQTRVIRVDGRPVRVTLFVVSEALDLALPRRQTRASVLIESGDSEPLPAVTAESVRVRPLRAPHRVFDEHLFQVLPLVFDPLRSQYEVSGRPAFEPSVRVNAVVRITVNGESRNVRFRGLRVVGHG